MKWFIVNVHTGAENKVARELRDKIDAAKLNPLFGEILVPTREITEIKGGKRVKTDKKFFPGYIVVQMDMMDETYTLVKNIPQVVMFLGQRPSNSRSGKSLPKPIPITEDEARRLMRQMEEGPVAGDAEYDVGQEVHVIDGPFANFNGVAADVDNLKQKMTVTILVFGRETSVALDFSQVEKL
jgi:transcriptional antiterminator NusG